LRQEAIKEAEKKRMVKHKNMEDDREKMREGIRDRYKIEKKEESEDEDDDDDGDDFMNSKKKSDIPEDPMAQKAQEVKAMAEQGLNAAKDKCKVQ
jgi:hypothetical protein